MRFLVDQNLPTVLADWLVEAGHAAEHVRLLGLAEADDAEIVKLARAKQAIVITRDGDFQKHAGPGKASIIWVRIGNTTNPALLNAWTRVWPDIEAALIAGETLVEVI